MGRLSHTGQLIKDFAQFAQQNKVYWIVPLLAVLALAALLVVAGQTATPFVYTLF